MKLKLSALLLLLALLCSACAAVPAETVEIANIVDEMLPLAEAPAAAPLYLKPEASGEKVKSGGQAEIDYSNTEDGYIMVKVTKNTTQRLKVQVAGPTTTYTYNLTRGQWETLPLSDGNGTYKVTVYENVTGTKYAAMTSTSMTVKLTDEFAPFLRPNQYVNYLEDSETVKKAAELCKNQTDPLKKVEKVYKFVVDSLKYDKTKAATVKSGYLPVLDDVLAAKQGICFDYAALMAGMLRSQSVPCKLVVGYAGEAYHAWINVWTKDTGWINGAIFFDGSVWHHMDPTFASSGNESEAIMKYIGDGSNYTAKYIY